MKNYIPNSITLFNLFCGCCALAAVFYGDFVLAFWLLFVAGLADYADGTVARALEIHSPLGKELDSLADMVSFGVVPGAIFYELLVRTQYPIEIPDGVVWWATPGFLLPVFSGLRLAKFNLDERQTDHFIGLPTPSSTVFVTGLMLIYHFDSFGMARIVIQPVVLYGLIALLCYLLIAEIPMFSFKFKSLRWAGNEIKFIFTGLSLIMLVLFREAAFSLIILLYILLNAFLFITNRTTIS